VTGLSTEPRSSGAEYQYLAESDELNRKAEGSR
jgi:hypothetical protein